ncbi:hypothetical protein EXS71_02840 [Candidatus Uhrbacteria bacterium]|nr:hypothetical protein [Candidatus Uhrbacteria bacterium]
MPLMTNRFDLSEGPDPSEHIFYADVCLGPAELQRLQEVNGEVTFECGDDTFIISSDVVTTARVDDSGALIWVRVRNGTPHLYRMTRVIR